MNVSYISYWTNVSLEHKLFVTHLVHIYLSLHISSSLFSPLPTTNLSFSPLSQSSRAPSPQPHNVQQTDTASASSQQTQPAQGSVNHGAEQMASGFRKVYQSLQHAFEYIANPQATQQQVSPLHDKEPQLSHSHPGLTLVTRDQSVTYCQRRQQNVLFCLGTLFPSLLKFFLQKKRYGIN